MTMEFIGKWSFAAPGGSCLLVVPSTNQLKFAAPAGDKNQNFNAYGASDKFMLQPDVEAVAYEIQQAEEDSMQAASAESETIKMTVRTISSQLISLSHPPPSSNYFYFQERVSVMKCDVFTFLHHSGFYP